MPAGRGIIQIQRFTVLQSVIQVSSVSPLGSSKCNENITITTIAGCASPLIAAPAGSTVQIINYLNGSVLGSGTISGFLGQANINISLSNSPYNTYQLIARYLGAASSPSFSSADSDVFIRVVDPDSVTVTITTPTGSSLCYLNDYTISATVSASVSANNPINDGYIKFYAQNGSNIYVIDGYSLVSGGVASSVIDGYDGYVMIWPSVSYPTDFDLYAQYYPARPCLSGSTSAAKTITLTDNGIPTTITGSPTPSSTSGAPITINVSVSASDALPSGTAIITLITPSLTTFVKNITITNGVGSAVYNYSDFGGYTGQLSLGVEFNAGGCWAYSNHLYSNAVTVS